MYSFTAESKRAVCYKFKAIKLLNVLFSNYHLSLYGFVAQELKYFLYLLVELFRAHMPGQYNLHRAAGSPYGVASVVVTIVLEH